MFNERGEMIGFEKAAEILPEVSELDINIILFKYFQ